MNPTEFPKIKWKLVDFFKPSQTFWPFNVVVLALIIFYSLDISQISLNYSNWVIPLYGVGFLTLLYLIVSCHHHIKSTREPDSPESNPSEEEPLIYKREFSSFAEFSLAFSSKKILFLLAGLILLIVQFYYLEQGKGRNELLTWLTPEVLLSIALFILLGRILNYFLQDFSIQLRYFMGYFYAPLIFIVILNFVLAQYDQFGTFFLELVDSPFNLLFFLLLFPASLLIIWFSPAYLYFTDKMQAKSVSSTQKHQPQLLYLLLLRHRNSIKDYYVIDYTPEPSGFTFFRVLLGIFYIGVLSTLAGGVILKSWSPDLEPLKTIILLFAILLGLYRIYFYNRWKKKWIGKERGREKNEESKKNHELIKSQLIGWKQNFIFIVVNLAFLFCLSIVLYYFRWKYDFIFPLLTLFLFITTGTVWVFVNVGYLYPQTDIDKNLNETDPEEKADHGRVLKYYQTFITLNLAANFILALLASLSFIILLLFNFDYFFPILEKINAINIYLLLVNGLIATLTIIDRYFRIRRKVMELNENKKKQQKGFLHAFTSYIWSISLIIFGIFYYIGSHGNDYHEVTYTPPYSKEATTKSICLEDYNEKFLARLDQKDPMGEEHILFVAADGGGLKAAYWTLLTLWKLDSMGLGDNIYMMSGASGGAIGQGIYTYLKAQGITGDALKEIILKLGDSNFISGDLAGLFTRWPMQYIPNVHKQIQQRQDRMEAMTKYYFDIIEEELLKKGSYKEAFSFDNIRQKPYHYIWQLTDYQLPLLFTNTARAEDGLKGWSHPLDEDDYLNAGAVNLSQRIVSEDSIEYIPLPDALFLANRFPLLSPAAKIAGKGHFIDAGAIDNSGMGTILHILYKMKAKPDLYLGFHDRCIDIISIRHDRSRWIEENFRDTLKNKLGKAYAQSEFGSFLGAIINAGIIGDPKVQDRIIKEGEAGKLIPIENLIPIHLPFRLTNEQVEDYFRRELIDKESKERVNNIVAQINTTINNICRNRNIVEPPLGRIISRPAQEYMFDMLQYEENWEKIESEIILKREK